MLKISSAIRKKTPQKNYGTGHELSVLYALICQASLNDSSLEDVNMSRTVDSLSFCRQMVDRQG